MSRGSLPLISMILLNTINIVVEISARASVLQHNFTIISRSDTIFGTFGVTKRNSMLIKLIILPRYAARFGR